MVQAHTHLGYAYQQLGSIEEAKQACAGPLWMVDETSPDLRTKVQYFAAIRCERMLGAMGMPNSMKFENRAIEDGILEIGEVRDHLDTFYLRPTG